VHTLLYAAFLEDPLTWALLGIGTALAAQTVPVLRRRRAGAGAAAQREVSEGGEAADTLRTTDTSLPAT
jgi:hypothetical protein